MLFLRQRQTDYQCGGLAEGEASADEDWVPQSRRKSHQNVAQEAMKGEAVVQRLKERPECGR